MATLHALVTSDWHFEKLKKLFPHDHIDRQIREIEKIYQYALEKGIKHVFIPGDISDTHKMNSETYMKMLLLFKKYDGIIHTYYTGGNHDYSDVTTTSMDLFQTILEGGYLETFHLFLQPEQIEVDGVLCNMMPHPAMESLPNKRPCLNFVHVEYTGAKGDNGRLLKSKHNFQSPKRDFNISGHIHQYQELTKRRAIYCGTPYQTNFGEALPKGFIEIRAGVKERKMVVKHRFIDNKPGFRLLTEEIGSTKDFAKLSTEPGIRYRLYLEEGVVVPSDLMIRNPNIVQVWHKNKNSKIATDVEQFRQETTELPQLNPTEGLAKVFKANGLKKSDYLVAKDMVKQALTEIS